MMEGTVTVTIPLSNTVTCYSCGVTIASLFRHDFQTCDCGAVSVDGGFVYAKRGFAPDAQWEEWRHAWQRDDQEANRLVREADRARREALHPPAEEWRSTFRAGKTRL